jgi:hypothetical protein
MVTEIDTSNIRKITFGILNKYIDVTEMILQKLNSGQTIHLTINIFPSDPYIGKVKRLIIYYESGFNMIINENEKCIKKHKSNEIINVSQNVSQNMSQNMPQNMPQNVSQNKNNFSNELRYIISTNARDEPNIVEWIMYHLMIGFDYIVIIDHKSEIPIQKIVDNYEWKNKVYVIRREDDGAVKIMFLNNIIIPFMMKHCKKYFIHLDADEYFYLDKKYNLDSFTKTINSDIIAINWLMFGTNNVEKNTNKYKCIIPVYTKSEETLNEHFKLLIRIDISNPFIFDNPHTIKYTTKRKSIYVNALGQKLIGDNIYDFFKNFKKIAFTNVPSYINHYYVQSKEDYIRRKINRERDDIFIKRDFDESIFNNSNNIENNNLLSYGNDIMKKLENYDNIMNDLLKLNEQTFGFIMIRYVKCSETNKSWIRCYESIRKFYNVPIVIIDDNSNMNYVSNHPTINCKIISSEFPRRGELLPYYYYIQHKFFKRAVVIHDSMEIVKYYNYNNIANYKNFSRLFSFGPSAYSIDIMNFEEMSKYINHGQSLFEYHIKNMSKLNGCFGICYVIDHDFLIHINNKYNIANLVNYINTRKKRQCLERFFSCLFEYEKINTFETRKDLFGSILCKQNQFEYIKKYFFGR